VLEIADCGDAATRQDQEMQVNSFTMPTRTLLGPGPSPVHERVLQAMAQPTIGHLDPKFQELMENLKELLRYAFRTRNPFTFPVSACGSAGMEMCFVNLVEPGDTVIVCENGVFGGRMRECVERCGGTPVVVQDDWGKPVSLEKVEDALRRHRDARLLAFVHAETSTGAMSNAEDLCRLAAQHDCLSLVDAVTSLGGIALEVDRWGIDAVYSGSQKCLSCPPGLSPVSFSERALARIRSRTVKARSWFLDLSLVMEYWKSDGQRSYHHTAPVNALYGLHEALVMLAQEGIEASWARHARMHERLRAGVETLGMRFVVDAEHRLPQVNTLWTPSQRDEAALRAALLARHGIEIGAGLGTLRGKVWRIGLMGEGAREQTVDRCLAALGELLA
jgi:alanine-glyoxylate transaminase / serine-glyoxylate transaminase / serine-pyruvate transaminase